MQLSEWLAREGIKRSRFAASVGVSPSHITGLCDGVSSPSLALAQRIHKETGGAVGPEDFFLADPSEVAAE